MVSRYRYNDYSATMISAPTGMRAGRRPRPVSGRMCDEAQPPGGSLQASFDTHATSEGHHVLSH